MTKSAATGAGLTLYRKIQVRYSDVCSADEIETLFDPARDL